MWAVHPAGVLGERRQADRRTRPVELVLDPPLLERRTGADRRGPRREHGRGSHVLPQQWQAGWLVFEEDRDAPLSSLPTVRRLAPIPDDWETCPEDELAAYLVDARQTERRSA